MEAYASVFGGGAGTASANARWKVQLINANMPTGTGSVKVVYPASGQTVCVKPNTSSKTTDAVGVKTAEHHVRPCG